MMYQYNLFIYYKHVCMTEPINHESEQVKKVTQFQKPNYVLNPIADLCTSCVGRGSAYSQSPSLDEANHCACSLIHARFVALEQA